jgi:hypothetical protein
MANTTATPLLMTDPGFLFMAPLGTALPAAGVGGTVAGSVFTDAWPAGWVNLGATEDGSEFSFSTSVEPIRVAEIFNPIQYSVTEQAASMSFSLASWTATNLRRAFNVGSGNLTTVSGTGATLLSKLTPPAPAQIVRQMVGWESLDATTRIIGYQVINGGEVTTAFKRAPDNAVIPFQLNFEVPASPTVPFDMFIAGANRVGT